MIGWFLRWLERLVQLGLALAGQLIAGILGGLLGGAATRATAGASGGSRVRRGSPDEVIDVRHRVLRDGLPRSTAIFAGDDAPSARHWLAERSGPSGTRVVGVVTVLAAPMPEPPPEASPIPAFQLRGMAVLPEHRGEHLGEDLLRAAQAEVGAPMWCNARTGVVGFYTKHGWRPVGGTFEVPSAGPHQRMWWPGPTTPAKRG